MLNVFFQLELSERTCLTPFVSYFKPGQFNKPPLFCFGLFYVNPQAHLWYLRCTRYVFAYLLVFCKFVLVLVLKYRTYRNKEQLRCDFSESDGKEIPNLQVLSS